MGSPYEQSNHLLRALYQEKLRRDAERRWENPDVFDCGGPESLRLCSMPSQYLGARLWLSGCALAKNIAQGAIPGISGGRCIEIGAGIGAVGIAAAMCGGAEEVLLTDKAEMLPLLQQNIKVNNCSRVCTTAELMWGQALPQEWQFDVVLAADVIYPTKDPSNLLALRETLFQLCPLGSSTRLVLAYHARATDDAKFLQNEILPHWNFEMTKVEMSDEQGRNVDCQIYCGVRQQQVG